MAAGERQPDGTVGTQATGILSVARRLVFRNKWTSSLFGLWIMGLLVAFALPAPVATTDGMLAAYTAKSRAASNRYDQPLTKAMQAQYLAEDKYHAKRVCTPRCLRVLQMAPASSPAVLAAR